MNNAKLTFERFEMKYLLTGEKYAALRQELDGRIVPDEYFKSTVCSIYYDTGDYALIRHSIDKPVYKEKLRLRSYGVPAEDGSVFVELKKKFKGTVYKRRIQTTAKLAEAWLSGEADAPEASQVSREIDWFLHMYRPEPRVLIACDREAYVSVENRELRFTFDKNIRSRESELSLCSGAWGERLMGEEMTLMEIKMPCSAPLWLSEMLSRLEIFPTGFSKYGVCYKESILPRHMTIKK